MRCGTNSSAQRSVSKISAALAAPYWPDIASCGDQPEIDCDVDDRSARLTLHVLGEVLRPLNLKTGRLSPATLRPLSRYKLPRERFSPSTQIGRSLYPTTMVGHGPQSRSQLSHTRFKHLRLI